MAAGDNHVNQGAGHTEWLGVHNESSVCNRLCFQAWQPALRGFDNDRRSQINKHQLLILKHQHQLTLLANGGEVGALVTLDLIRVHLGAVDHLLSLLLRTHNMQHGTG